MKKYNLALAVAGLSVAFIFMLFAAIIIYGAASLVIHGGFWYCLGGVALMLPMFWSVYLATGVLDKTVIRQP